MSCRILPVAAALSARPLFGLPQQVPETQEPVPEPAPAESEPPPVIAELHNRIVELERALQRDVRLAREGAYKEGEKEGRERATAELQPVIDRLGRSIADLATLRSRIKRDTEQELVQLSIAIARRILRRELTVDPDALHGLVRAALDKIQSRDISRVRVHPAHQASVRRYLDKAELAPAVEITGDPALQPGDVVIETRRGDLDASIDTQLAEIERGFADRLER